MDVKVSYRSPTSQNFRKIIDFHNMETCPIMMKIEKYPAFTESLDWFNKSFPGLVQKCPYKSFLITNASLVKLSSNEGKARMMYVSPNGVNISK